MKQRLALLIGGVLAFWLIAAYPARLIGGDTAVLHVSVAAVLCLVPMAGTLAWAFWAKEQAPEQQLLMVLGGTGIRMFFVLGAGFGLSALVPVLREQSFWIWVLVVYLFTLALEMVLILASRGPSPGKR